MHNILKGIRIIKQFKSWASIQTVGLKFTNISEAPWIMTGAELIRIMLERCGSKLKFELFKEIRTR